MCIMKVLSIYEPAMCCSTGLCGVSVDPELLRISTVFNNLSKNGFEILRYNLSGSPQAFVDNKLINQVLSQKGSNALPITMIDGEIVKLSGYPTNHEIMTFLGITEDYLCRKVLDVTQNNNNYRCNCNGGECY